MLLAGHISLMMVSMHGDEIVAGGFPFVQFPKGKHTQASALQLVPIYTEPLVQKKKKTFLFLKWRHIHRKCQVNVMDVQKYHLKK